MSGQNQYPTPTNVTSDLPNKIRSKNVDFCDFFQIFTKLLNSINSNLMPIRAVVDLFAPV